jgi:hypothetical protein
MITHTFLFLAAFALALLLALGRADNGEITRAKEIFTKAAAQDICTKGESSKTRESEATDHAARPSEAAYSHARP